MFLESLVIDANESILSTIYQIEYSKARAVLVKEENKVKGIITEGDIMRLMLKGTNLHSPIGNYVKEKFLYLTSKDMEKAH